MEIETVYSLARSLSQKWPAQFHLNTDPSQIMMSVVSTRCSTAHRR